MKLLSFIILGQALFFSATAFAAGGLSYHGRLLAPSGVPVTSPVVSFRIQIRSPGSENCLLFEEEQVADLSQTSGVFTLTIGEDPGKRKDTTGLSFDRIFSNQGTFNLPGQCLIGGSFSPGYADNRKIQVYFNDGTFSGWEPMPIQMVNYVPTALNALQVGGFTSANLLRVENGGIPQSVSSMTSAQFAEMMKLILGTSTQYLKTSSTGASLPSFSSDPSGANAGQMWYDSSGNVIKFYNGSTVQTLGVSGSGISSLTAGTGLTGGTITTSGTIALATAGTAGTYYQVTTDAYGRVTSGQSSLVEADIPTLSMAGKVSGSAITSGAIGGSTSISTTGPIVTTNDITSKRNILYDHSGAGPGFVGMQAPADMSGVNYTLTFPATAGAAGQVLSTTNTSGTLAWTNLVATDLSTIAGAGIVQRNGANSYSTVSVLSPLSYTGGNLGVNAGSGGVLLDGGNSVTGTLSAGTISNHNVDIKTANAVRMTIDNTGKVGIGTTTPSTSLHVNGTATFGDGATWGPSGFANSATYSSVDTSFFNLNPTYNFSGTSNFTTANISPILVPTGASAGAINVFSTAPTIGTSAVDISQLRSFTSNMTVSAGYTGTISSAFGVLVNPISNLGSKPITTSYGLRANGTTTNGNGITTGTVTNIALGFHGSSAAAGVGGTLVNQGLQGVLPSGASAGTSNYGIYLSGNGGASATNYAIYNSSTADNYFAGKVGIGTTSPGAKLSVNGAASRGIDINTSNQTPWALSIRNDTATQNGLQFVQMDDGTSRIYNAQGTANQAIVSFGASGNVGIGTTSPTAKFEVNGVVKATSFEGTMVSSGTSNASGYTINSDTDSSGNDGGINFQVRGSTKLAVTDGGRVSVGGATTPVSLLANTNTNTNDTAGTGSTADSLTWLTNAAGYVASFTNTSSATNANGIFAKTTGTAATNRILNLNANGADVMTVTGQGNVGIGTASPGHLLHLASNSAATLNIDSAVSGSTGAPAVAMRSSRGTLTSPSAAQLSDHLFYIGGNGYGATGFGSSAQVSIRGQADQNFTDAAQGTRLIFETTTIGTTTKAERMRIDSSGKVGIGTTSPDSSLSITSANASDPGVKIYNSATGTGIAIDAYYPTVEFNRWHDGTNARAFGTGYTGALNMDPTTGDFAFITGNNPGTGSIPSNTQPVTIKNNGNIGIGTASPNTMLDIRGNINFGPTSDGTPANQQKITSDGSGASMRFTTPSAGGIFLQPNNATAKANFTSNVSCESGSNFCLANGRVGIGTISPALPLDVNGAAAFKDALQLVKAGNHVSDDSPAIFMRRSRNIASSPQAVNSADYIGSLAFGGYDGTTWRDGWNGGASISSVARENWNATNHGADMIFSTTTVGSTNADEKMRITPSGNVGIGTGAPVVKLHVYGSGGNGGAIKSESTTAYQGLYVQGVDGAGVNDTSFLMLQNGTTAHDVFIGQVGTSGIGSGNVGDLRIGYSSSGEKMRISRTTGNVGIGSTNPIMKLEVNSGSSNGIQVTQSGSSQVGMRFSAPGPSFLDFHNSAAASGGKFFRMANDGGNFKLQSVNDAYTAHSELLTVSPTGNVGIGTASPTYQLQLSTDSAAKPGTSTWTIASDERLKDVRAPFTRGLEALNGLNTIYFNYKKENPLHLPYEKEYVGIKAQDAQRMIPESVTIDEQGYLHVTNDSIIWTAVNAIKELYVKFQGQAREIASLKESKAERSEIESLKARNQKLEQENLLQAEDLRKLKERLDKIEDSLKSK